MELLLERLRLFCVQEAIIATGYRSEMIEAYFRDGARVGLTLTYHSETQPLGTAGPLATLAEHFSHPFFVVNGDILTRLNFADLYRFHLSQDSDLTVAVREVRWRIPYGTVQVNGSRLTAIQEKPIMTHLINTGIYVVSPAAVARIPRNTTFDMPQLVSDLIQDSRVTFFHFTDLWLDVGNIEDLERATATVHRWEQNQQEEETEEEILFAKPE
jgi:NDP-sugar pyrophosphorylase family protein